MHYCTGSGRWLSLRVAVRHTHPHLHLPCNVSRLRASGRRWSRGSRRLQPRRGRHARSCTAVLKGKVQA